MHSSTRRHLAVPAVALCALLAGAVVVPGVSGATVAPRADESRDRSDRRVVGQGFERSHGRVAVARLADRLPEAARLNGLSAEGLREVLLEDETAWLDDDARLYYEEPAFTEGVTASAATAPAAAYPLEQTFLLQSKPGSRHTIFLDFDGHVVRDTAWSVTEGSKPAWTLDDNPDTFSDAERRVVQSVWRRVAEDYAPFDVNVTTRDPGSDAITRFGDSDSTWGTRALITPSPKAQQELCKGSCGGIAYINVFDTPNDHADYQPAWVFPQSLGNDPKYIAEAVSHEVGHNLGLRHDGVNGGSSYYSGHGTWAPIMGASYSRAITQWSRGTYRGADNEQDDLLAISHGGAPLHQDEALQSVAAMRTSGATNGPPPGTAYITSDADRDVYALGVCSGPMTASARPSPVSPNLDIRLSLLDATGAVVKRVNPASNPGSPTRDVANGMGARFERDARSDVYYVMVEGVGHGSPSTGYDGYSSVGGYSLSVTASCLAEADVPSALQGFAAAASDGGRSVALQWQPPVSSGTSPISHYRITWSGGDPVVVTDPSHTFTGLRSGTPYDFDVVAVNNTGAGPASAVTAPLYKPGRTRINRPRSGAWGGRVTATARWQAPRSDGGDPVTGYQVSGYRVDHRGRVLGTITSPVLRATARSWQPTVRRARWKFAVRAKNDLGWGPRSSRSRAVIAR